MTGEGVILEREPSLEPLVGGLAEELGEHGQLVLLLARETLGDAGGELGATLMQRFLLALSESIPAPAAVILVNAGVRLARKGRPTADSLAALVKQGTDILVCGLSLDRLGTTCDVGRVADTYQIIDWLNRARKVVAL